VSAGFLYDRDRAQRIGLPEAVLCEPKTAAQITLVLNELLAAEAPILLTRLVPERWTELRPDHQARLDYDPVSHTAMRGELPSASLDRTGRPAIAILTAGTSDAKVAAEAARTLAFHGIASQRFQDLGTAGLWRLLAHLDELAAFPVIIAVAGMEGALFTVLGGLVPSAIIAVPTSTGYGVTAGGSAAMTSALGSCAPGLLTVNIDNGYGAACAALRILRGSDRTSRTDEGTREDWAASNRSGGWRKTGPVEPTVSTSRPSKRTVRPS
jgi:NCAIR mutase (PurE)-related protein